MALTRQASSWVSSVKGHKSASGHSEDRREGSRETVFPSKLTLSLWSFSPLTLHITGAFLFETAPVDEVPGAQADDIAWPAGPRCGTARRPPLCARQALPAALFTWEKRRVWTLWMLAGCPGRPGPSCRVSRPLTLGSRVVFRGVQSPRVSRPLTLSSRVVFGEPRAHQRAASPAWGSQAEPTGVYTFWAPHQLLLLPTPPPTRFSRESHLTPLYLFPLGSPNLGCWRC